MARHPRLLLVGLLSLFLGACPLRAEMPIQPQCTARSQTPSTCGPDQLPVTCEGRERCMTRPKFVSRPTPYLPPVAIANRVTGVAILACTITEQGTVEDCSIVQSLPYSDIALAETLQEPIYSPALLDNKPVRVRYQTECFTPQCQSMCRG